jgi:hypothetical protein
MEFTVSEAMGPRFLEGVPNQSCMRHADDAVTVLQECLSRRVDRVMLYSENLPDRFFDLSSGEAGAILQKFRNYNIRLAVVCPSSVRLSQRFGEMVAEERRGRNFGLFETKDSARQWLSRD